ncbi:MAG: Rieske (2Fe-2S) protein [Candidatus Polarisedimenticolia bacterium]
MPHIEVRLEDLPEGRPVRLEAAGQGVVVVRKGASVLAYEDVCPHAGWRLSDGEVNGDHIECPGHGWRFAAATGRCVEVPFYCLKPVVVRTVDGAVRLSWDWGGEKADGPAVV